MPHALLDSVLCQARKLAVGGSLEDTPDLCLLHRFAMERDEAAFSQLVQRHGPMVIGPTL